jgi:hypothetical protein
MDRKALLALKAAVVTGSSRLNTWRTNGAPCSGKPWAYVTCTDGRVTGLNLANVGLAGQLPDNLRLASELVTVNLADNKFTGSIPAKWANQQSLKKLKVLNLSNNNFAGTLPLFNKLNAWKSLETLDLSGNSFTTLPNEWVGANRPLRNVKLLDLSRNLLATGWCAVGTGDKWCTVAPTTGALASLEIFDISNNDIPSALPTVWPAAMPRLTTLIIAGNFFSAADTAAPAPIPDTFAGGAKRGFPALQSLVLYPGNSYLCSIPTNTEYGFRDVNLDASYKVLDLDDGQWDASNPAPCPVSLGDDVKAGTVTLAKSTADITLALALDAAAAGVGGWDADKANEVYGFKITVSKQQTDGLDETSYVPLAAWNARIVRTYAIAANTAIEAAEDAAITLDATGAVAAFTVVTAATVGGKYQATVTAILVDGSEGPAVSGAEFTMT